MCFITDSERIETVKGVSRRLKPLMKHEARVFDMIFITSMQRFVKTLPFKPISPNQVAFYRTLKTKQENKRAHQWVKKTRGANTEM